MVLAALDGGTNNMVIDRAKQGKHPLNWLDVLPYTIGISMLLALTSRAFDNHYCSLTDGYSWLSYRCFPWY